MKKEMMTKHEVVPFLSYAQNMEDLRLFRALRGVDRGFYVDVGAGDPVAGSVTRGFYNLGWSGINVEPIARHFQDLSRDRPRDISLHLLASDVDDVIDFYEIPSSPVHSTTEPALAERAAAAGLRARRAKLPSRRLEAILDQYHPTGEIHFLKIDVEGAEDKVLAGIDLRRHRPWIIVMEVVLPFETAARDLSWSKPILLDRGYRAVFYDGMNNYYVSDEHADLAESFRIPPNSSDFGRSAPDWFYRPDRSFRQEARRFFSRQLKSFRKRYHRFAGV